MQLSTVLPDAGHEQVENVVRDGLGAKLIKDPNLTKDKTLLNEADEHKMRPDFWIVRAALWFGLDKRGAVTKITET